MLLLLLDAKAVAEKADILLADIRSILANETQITQEIFANLNSVFGISPMLFYDIQRNFNTRKK